MVRKISNRKVTVEHLLSPSGYRIDSDALIIGTEKYYSILALFFKTCHQEIIPQSQTV